MARKRQDSNFVMMVDIFADLPWWVCFPVALVAYVGISLVWTKLLGGNKMIVGVAGYGKVVAGFFASLILAAGGFGQFVKFRRRKIYEQQTGIDSITKLSWREFETLVGEAYRRKGYEVRETGGGGADGGIDLILQRGSEKTVVQCKQWRVYKVGVKPVRELFGVMTAEQAAHAIFVTSGRYTEEAERFATGKPLELIDRESLLQLMAVAKTGTTSAESKTPTTPVCPRCATPMVRRPARRGDNAGGQFWGCPNFPKCTGIRQLDEQT